MDYDHVSSPLDSHAEAGSSQYICVNPVDLSHLNSIAPSVADGQQSSCIGIDSSHHHYHHHHHTHQTGLSKLATGLSDTPHPSYVEINAAHLKGHQHLLDASTLTYL